MADCPAFRCDQVQGFLLGKPMPMDDFEACFGTAKAERLQGSR